MIKIITITLCLLTLSTAVTYQKFISTKLKCNDERKIFGGLPGSAQCQYDIIGSKLIDSQCGRDYYKSNICQTTFKQCFNIKPLEQYPYVCYLCWVESPATSLLYQSFQKCIADTVWQQMLITKILMAVMLLFFMYMI